MPTGKNGCGRLYDVNGKRVYVYKYPDLSLTPEALGVLIVIIVGTMVLDFFNLSVGGVASEEQFRLGIYASSESRTGPGKDYHAEAVDLVKKEVRNRDCLI